MKLKRLRNVGNGKEGKRLWVDFFFTLFKCPFLPIDLVNYDTLIFCVEQLWRVGGARVLDVDEFYVDLAFCGTNDKAKLTAVFFLGYVFGGFFTSQQRNILLYDIKDTENERREKEKE